MRTKCILGSVCGSPCGQALSTYSITFLRSYRETRHTSDLERPPYNAKLKIVGLVGLDK